MNPTKNISTLQDSICLTQHIYPRSPLFNVGGYALIHGAIQMPLLIKAITTVLEHTDVIETGYMGFNDMPLNSNANFIKYDIDVVDCSQQQQAADVCLKWMHDDMQSVFDTGRCLLKLRLLKASDDKCYWYAKVHHVLFDGYAMALFFNNVSRLYTTWISGHTEADVPSFSYGKFIADELQYKSSDQYQDDRRWWLERLGGTGTSAAFQSCVHANNRHTMSTQRLEIRIEASLFYEITAFCKLYHCTAFHYFIAVLFVLHKRYNNQEALLLGVPVFNRSSKQFKETLGAFVNILPFSVPVEDDRVFSQLLPLVAAELKECYRHQRFPLYDMLKELDRKGNIYNVSFSYQKNSYNTSLGNAAAAITYLPPPEQQEDLFFHLLEYEDGADLTLALDYAVDLFPEHVAKNILIHFKNLLKAALRTPDMAVNSLPYLTEGEESALLDRFKVKSPGYDTGATIITCFEQQVAQSAERTALVFKDSSFSYSSLDGHANQLARYLQEHYRVSPGDLVGLQLERSEWQVISILGVLKAGGAYVPIDPGYPEERISYITRDSGCKLVIDKTVLDHFLELRCRYSTAGLPLQAGPSDLA
ncbi:AMP-binding enzyme, partial [Chitinophaga eiseniae]